MFSQYDENHFPSLEFDSTVRACRLRKYFASSEAEWKNANSLLSAQFFDATLFTLTHAKCTKLRALFFIQMLDISF